MKNPILIFLFSLLLSPSLFAQSAPGGVTTNLNYWLKADAGVNLDQGRVDQWENQSLNQGSTIQSINQNSDNRQPNFTPNALNFNPGITFNVLGNDFDFLRSADEVWDSDTVFIVFNPNQNLGNNVTLQAVLVYDIPNNTFGDAGIGIGSFPNTVGNFFNSTDSDANVPGEYIATSQVSPNTTGDSVLAVVRQVTIANPDSNQSQSRSELRFWGEDAQASILNPSQFAGHQNRQFTIGQRNGGGLPFDGDVLEAISYSATLNDDSVRKIESYLSIKYGLTLNQSNPQDYINSLGSTIYDSSGSLSLFTSNIAGIGRDDNSGLNQKQSTSTTTNSVQDDNNGLITIGLGSIEATNVLNTNSFSNDQSFLLWGNNAASLSFDSPLTISSTPLNHMQRTWAIQETGNVGSVTIQVPQSIFNTELVPSILISSDSEFNSSDRVVALQDDGNNNFSANINFNDGEFFTFAQSEQAITSPSIFVTPLPNGKAVIFGL